MFHRSARPRLIAGIVLSCGLGICEAATFTVTSTSPAATSGGCDSDCTLHDAIIAANVTVALDTIAFAIPGTGVKTITLDADGLPTINRPVVIDGYTQTGATVNTATIGSNAVLTIALRRQNPDPANDTITHALEFAPVAIGSVVRGIAFEQLGTTSVSFIGTDADNMVIEGNFFGTNAAGNADGGQAPGAAITVRSGANNTTIGGVAVASRNLFAGIEEGIVLAGTSASVRNNTFGVEDNGSDPLPLGDIGILITGTTNVIGGIENGEGNLFANIDGHAIQVSNTANGNRLLGNTFENNSGLSINLARVGDPSNGVTPNDDDDSDGGANRLQNHPEMLAANRSGNDLSVQFSFASTASRTFRFELYAATTPDPSGFGEGEQLITTFEFGSGTLGGFNQRFLFNVGNAVPAGTFVTLTATDLTTGDTSEFSRAIVVADDLSVNSNSDIDDGACDQVHCSLREAILAANTRPGVNRVQFDIAGNGPHTILVGAGGLPAITESVVIDGRTQAGHDRNMRLDGGNDASRMIVLSAPSLNAGVNVMTLAAGSDGSFVTDLSFRDTDTDANAMLAIDSNGNSLFGCSFGLDAAGLADGGNSPASAVRVTGDGNNIGSSAPGSRLQFGGIGLAVQITGDDNTLSNVTIGLDSLGNATVPNTGARAILVSGFDNRITSGTSNPNRIFGNTGKGIQIAQFRDGNQIDRTLFSGNGGIAIDLDANGDPQSGITPNDTNDADTGANDLQNHPVITSASRDADGDGEIIGTLNTNPVNGTVYEVDVYHSATRGAFDSGQGQTLIGTADVTVNAQGAGSFAFLAAGLPPGGFVSALARRTSGSLDTSEISPAVALINAPIIVTNTNSFGGGSLPAAILAANQLAGPDRIEFAIPGVGPFRINAGNTGLPPITGPVFIDGYSQTAALRNQDATGFDGILRIEVHSDSLPDGASLVRFGDGSDDSRMAGLALLRTGGSDQTFGVFVDNADRVHLDGNLIGTDISGTSGLGFSVGVIYGLQAHFAQIGGASVGQRNLLANNQTDIAIVGDDATVQTNLIGRGRDGTVTPGSSGSGISLSGRRALIGGVASARNFISGHARGITVQGNGTADIRRNLITEIGEHGIDLFPLGQNPNDPGDADTGPNGLQNFPVFTSVSSGGAQTQITGTISSLPNVPVRIELFRANETSSGGAEAFAFLDDVTITPNASGDGTFSFTITPVLPVGSRITATATAINGSGQTSELTPPESVAGVDLVVNSTNDANDGACNSAHCSLREALVSANANSNLTRIRFQLTGGGQFFTITPQSALPAITAPLILDGYSQEGARTNSNVAPPNNAIIRIVLDGTAIAGVALNPEMLSIESSDVEIRGLSIVGLGDGSIGNQGISAPTNVNIDTANVRIRGNYIGLMPDGSTVDGNRVGIELGGEADDGGSVIGGPLPEHQNVISGNEQHGIVGSAAGVIVQNNLIGTAGNGIDTRRNGGNGIQWSGNTGALITGNLIAFNENGVALANSARGITIDPNSIHGNVQLGIDLGLNGVTPNDPLDADTGSNNLTNTPELILLTQSGQNRTIRMTLPGRPDTAYAVSYHGERSCSPEGLAEGELLLTSSQTLTSDAGGVAEETRTLALPAGFTQVTAIATDLITGETSEFSRCARFSVDGVFADSFE